jgi:hypothetical protein
MKLLELDTSRLIIGMPNGNCHQRSSIGAVGVRLCSSAQLAMPLEFKSLKLPGFAQGSGQPQTAARLCFMLKYGSQAPIAANAAVSWRFRVKS